MTRQIAADGYENGAPTNSIWEFTGDRIIVRDSGPGGAMRIKVDDAHSPAHIELTIEADSESGLGLLSNSSHRYVATLARR